MPQNYRLTIDGLSLPGEGEALQVINPATESVIADLPQASLAQLDNAVLAAKLAFESWRHTSCEQRKALIAKIADTLEIHSDELAQIIVSEQGKPLALAHAEVQGAIAWTRYHADLDMPVEILETRGDKHIELHRKPLGVIASITPWNWPLMIAIWHIIPALRAGNTVVCKPSELTPLNTLRAVQLINEVLPAGVLNCVIGGSEIGSAISRHSDIAKIVFTGSSATGQHIMRSAAVNLKRLTLELGGNDAAIVLPDSELDVIAEPVFQTAFLNMGQTCACIKRLYVHRTQYQEMCDKLANIATQQVVGDGIQEGTTFGPVQNARQRDIVDQLVQRAREAGADVLCGGVRPTGKGYFYPPTLVANLSNGSPLVDREPFGPVLPIIAYDTVEEAVRLANDCDVGLGASVWSPDIERAQQVASQLESGTVWINGHAEVLPHIPFGGCKMSGFGVEFGLQGLLENTRPQVVNINR